MKRFLTHYEVDGEQFSSQIDALDWEHADQLAAAKDPPEVVIGVLYAVVVAPHWTDEDANRFAQAIAESGDEPPDADTFDI